MLMWPEDGAGGWHHCLSVQLPAEQQLCSWAHMRTGLPNPKRAFPFSPPCTFSSFSFIICGQLPLSLVACPCFFAPETVLSIFSFYTVCCYHISSSVPNPTQSLQSFPKVSQKILPILPHCHIVPSGRALLCPRGWGEIASSPHPLILHVPLSTEGASKRLVHAIKGETNKRIILLALFMSDFSAEWG